MADEKRQDARALALVKAHAARRDSYLIALLKALLGLWGGFKQWENRDLVYAHAARSAVLVDTTMNKTRLLARSYAQGMLRELDASPSKPLPAIEDIYPRSGVTALEVYQRPVNQYLYELKSGVAEATAREHALERFEELASMDVMLAERDETQRVFEASPKVTGRRRIIHPELSKYGETCGLCLVASDNVYHVSELMPIHEHCNCTDMPITATDDPGFRINRDDLERLYRAAADTPGRKSTAGEDLKRVRIEINEHGELGPILTAGGHVFRDYETANKDSARKEFTAFERANLETQRASWRAMAESATRSIGLLEATRTDDVDANKSIDEAIKYHRDLIARFEQKAR